jgi:hypothetical protein
MKRRAGDPWMPAAKYGRTLVRLTLRRFVRDVKRSLPSSMGVPGLLVIDHDPDVAALEGPDGA